jgi:subtilisin family serine protease
MKSGPANDAMNAWALGQGLDNENDWSTDNMSHWSWTGPTTTAEMVDMLQNGDMAADIEYVEPNYIYQEAQVAGEFTLSEVLNFPVVSQTQTAVNIQQNELWASLSPGNPRPIIAIIDTGIDTNHVTFTSTGALWVNPGEIAGDGIDNDGNGFVDDINGYNFRDKNANITDLGGHGTHCAGIALGVGQNIFLSPQTIAPAKVQIMALKFIGSSGGSTSDAINAIYYAVRNGAKVISNSWGGPSDSRALEDAIKFAYDNEVVFVAAAGNSSANNDVVPTYPAFYRVPNVISVAATDFNDSLATFSNFGTASVDMAAPGVSILSTYKNGVFKKLSGTSMATPFVAGTAALQLYERSDLLAYQVKNILLEKSVSAPSLSGKIANPVRLNPFAVVEETKIVAKLNDHPAYGDRAVASAAAEEPASGGGGCGTIMKIGGNLPPPSNPPWAMLAFLFIPLALALRLRATPASYRRF